jgi:SAM-dependent methyltransferase
MSGCFLSSSTIVS